MTSTDPRPGADPGPLSDPDLARLQHTYGRTWRIWCTPNWWMATARVGGITPTLMERTPDELERCLRNPGRQVGGPLGATTGRYRELPYDPDDPDNAPLTEEEIRLDQIQARGLRERQTDQERAGYRFDLWEGSEWGP